MTKTVTELCFRNGLAIALLLLALTGPAYSQTAAGQWRVETLVGQVNWRKVPASVPADTWHPLKAGETISPPAEIETAPGAHIELVSGGDRIKAGPDSLLTIEAPRGGVLSLIRQAAGAVWYGIRHLGGRSFEVESRYLVATVKGTRFSVSLDSKGDLLSVSEGIVRAVPRGGGDGMDVGAGQSVLATASGLLLVVPPDGREPKDRPRRTESPVENSTGDAHGINSEGQHDHGGQGGSTVRGLHGDYKSEKGGGANAQGPK